MKIKKNLPQFENKKSLIFTSGGQEGIVYIAWEGKIDKVEHISEETPAYSDREEHFMKSATKQDVVQGSVYENKKEYIRKKFIKRATEIIKSITKEHDIESLYIFCPQYLENDLLSALPASISKRLVYTFFGNFSKEHEFDLLNKIKEKRDEVNPLKPISPEALKLKKRKSGK